MVTPGRRTPRTLRSVSSKLAATLWGIYRACGPRVTLSYVVHMVATAPEIVRTGTLVPADQRMINRKCRWTVQGIAIDLDGRYWPGAREMYGRSVYFPTQDFHLRPGTIVVDLGSNVGLFSLLAAKIGCRVIAVEAQIGLVRQMQASVERLGLDANVALENALIGAGTGVFKDTETFLAQPDVEGPVPTITLDELLAKHRVDEVDFLKVDIEGSEFELFSGDLGWLSKVRRIAVEVHMEFGTPESILHALRRNRFTVELRDENLSKIGRLFGPAGYIFASRQ
jgi:FkbM family methyltransferase